MQRYHIGRKITKAEAIVEIAKNHDSLTEEEVGGFFNVSKQYVSELLIKDRKAKWEKSTRVSFKKEDIMEG